MKKIVMLMLLPLFLGACSSDDEDLAATTEQQEEQQPSKMNDNEFLNAFVGNYWNVVEYGLLMNDGTKNVAFDEEGVKNQDLMAVQGGTLFPGIQVLNDSIIREFYSVILVGDKDGNWYQDLPFTFDTKLNQLTHNSLGCLLSDKLIFESVDNDRIQLIGEVPFASFNPYAKNSYYVLRKLSEEKGAEMYGKYREWK